MKKLFFLILLFGNFTITKSQEGSTQDWSPQDQKIFESATELFNKRYYELAYEKYVLLTANHEKDMFLKFVRGVCGVYINGKHKEAEKLLTEVKKNDVRAEGIDYYLALLYHKSYRFDKALELTNSLLSNINLTKDDRADLERIAFYSKNGKNEIQYPLECLIENLGSPLNSEYAEYGPVITPDEESIIYTYRGKISTGGLVDGNNKPDPNGDYNEDILISKKINGKWQQPSHLGALNTIGNDAVIALSPDGNELFVFKTEGDNGDIYVCKRQGDSYGSPEKLAGSVNSPYWEGSLSISTDQKKLFFASSRPGGFGGKDLYVATKGKDGVWGNVKNLGAKINTQYDEDAPFIAPDSRILIFSSEGHNSIGDFDLFISDWNKTDSSWQTPKNLGYPINTTDDDLFYVVSPDGKRGYFSSAREGGKGDQDMYVVEPALSSKKTFIALVKGKVTHNNLPLETEIEVSFAGESKNYGVYRSNALSGHYILNLPLGEKYKLVFKHKTLGEKIYMVSTTDVDDYAEKTIDVVFTSGDVAQNSKPNVVVVTNKDTVSIVHKAAVVVNSFKNEKTETPSIKEEPVKENKSTDEKISVTPTKTEKITEEKIVALNKSEKTSKQKIKNKSTKAAETKESDTAKSENVTVVSETKTGCGGVKIKFDSDFNYKKCDGIWYTKSKANAYSKYARGFFKEWESLSNNTMANEKLNARYPKG